MTKNLIQPARPKLPMGLAATTSGKRGNVYTACMQAIAALSVNSVTATGIIITNPLTSKRYYVFLELLFAIGSAPAGVSCLALVGSPGPTAEAGVTHTTPMT